MNVIRADFSLDYIYSFPLAEGLYYISYICSLLLEKYFSPILRCKYYVSSISLFLIYVFVHFTTRGRIVSVSSLFRYRKRENNKAAQQKRAAQFERSREFVGCYLLPSLGDGEVENYRDDSEQDTADNCPCLELLFQSSSLCLVVV